MPNTFLKQRIRHGRVAGFGHGELLVDNRSACTVLLSASRTVTATFTSNPLRVTLASVGGGTGTVTGVGNAISCGTFCTTGFPPNTVATLTAAPAQGAVFTRWSGCSSANGSTAPC